MRDLFPAILPFHQGFLPEVDGHSVFYELSGNPKVFRYSLSMVARAPAVLRQPGATLTQQSF